MSDRLRLGIDAELLWDWPSGIPNYLRHTALALGAVDPHNDYRLIRFYSTRKRSPLPFPSPATNVRFKIVRMPFPMLDRLDERPGRLGWELLAGGLDACLFAGGTFHPLRRGANVGLICDLVPIVHPETMRSPALAGQWAQSIRRRAEQCDEIVTISEASRAEIVAHLGVAPERVTVALPGIDAVQFSVRPPPVVDEVRARYGVGPSYLLFAGTLEPRKNVERLVEAFLDLGAAGAGLELVLVGRAGWGTEALERRLAALGDAGAPVKRLGHVPDDDLAALYSGALAAVVPSIYEGFGLPVIEAMACGAPVITSDRSSLPEAAGGAARLVDPYSVASITEALAAVVTQPDLRATMRARGLERVKPLRWRATALAISEVLQRAAAGRRATAR